VPPARVNRFDVAEIGKPVRTPQGFLRVPAFLTRAGVLAYTRADGTVVRELRPPDEVFAPDSLASLAAAPLTDLHPTEMVSPKNVRQLRRGHVNEAVRRDGRMVAATVTVEDEDTIAKVERGDLREISCGYQCQIDPTPGEFEGERYDVVQRGIVYNHAALGPRNWGRAGSEVALRLDSGDAMAASTVEAPPERRGEDTGPRAGGETVDLTNVRVDGLDIQVPKQWAQVVEKALKQRDDALGALTKERDTAQGKLDAANTALTESQKKLAELQDPKRLDGAVAARMSLLEQARRVLPATDKLDGLSTRQVHEAVLKKLDTALDLTGKSDDYVVARFDHAIATLGPAQPRNDAFDRSREATGPRHLPPAPLAAPAPYIPPWQQPLSVSKDR
jgi:uncharacterized protein